MSNSVRPHKQQPTRLPCPWDSPGKNTGVGCHFPLQCRKVKVKVKSCLTVSDPMDCSLPGSSVHGIFQARVLERKQNHEMEKVQGVLLRALLISKFSISACLLGARKRRHYASCEYPSLHSACLSLLLLSLPPLPPPFSLFTNPNLYLFVLLATVQPQKCNIGIS